ncbi:MAG: hypothetical protein K9N62_12025 [Verrucomicrobia bacterium]|nr:hypothetical protein [Verrucomicrobiota bacterium]
MSAHTEQRKLTASIPPTGTDRVGCSTLSRWVPRRSNDLDFGTNES